MALDNHPASFANISRRPAGAADDVPPPTWTHDGVDHLLVPRDGGWDVYVDDELFGRVEHNHPADENAPRSWSIRDPAHDGFGIGANWADWRDALVALVDYRRS